MSLGVKEGAVSDPVVRDRGNICNRNLPTNAKVLWKLVDGNKMIDTVTAYRSLIQE
jgi:hypothetical protein